MAPVASSIIIFLVFILFPADCAEAKAQRQVHRCARGTPAAPVYFWYLISLK